jgi:hypothetical protein
VLIEDGFQTAEHGQSSRQIKSSAAGFHVSQIEAVPQLKRVGRATVEQDTIVALCSGYKPGGRQLLGIDRCRKTLPQTVVALGELGFEEDGTA